MPTIGAPELVWKVLAVLALVYTAFFTLPYLLKCVLYPRKVSRAGWAAECAECAGRRWRRRRLAGQQRAGRHANAPRQRSRFRFHSDRARVAAPDDEQRFHDALDDPGGELFGNGSA